MIKLCGFICVLVFMSQPMEAAEKVDISENVYSEHPRLPDVNQMHPSFKGILGEGWPLCGPVQGVNFLLWLQDQKLLKERIEPNYKDLLKHVKYFAGKDRMNTRDEVGTEGKDFVRGIRLSLRDRKLDLGLDVTGIAFGDSSLPSLEDFLPRSGEQIWFVQMGYYRKGDRRPGLRRLKGHIVMLSKIAGSTTSFYAVDSALESAGEPVAEKVELVKRTDLILRKENRFFLGEEKPKLIEIRGLKSPEKLKAETILIEGVLRISLPEKKGSERSRNQKNTQ